MRLRTQAPHPFPVAFSASADRFVEATSMSVHWTPADAAAYPVQINFLPAITESAKRSRRAKVSKKVLKA
jgi:hypothetical protein